MAEYPPPVDNFPIFDALAFLEPLNATITQSDADARYLAKTGTASSSASSTIFSGDISSINATSKNQIINNTDANTGLNGLSITQGAMFGRNDTTANSFNGVLGYTRHPIGWTISATKNVAIPTSTVAIDVITQGTAITAFNTLSNGVWKLGCICNNNPVLGMMQFVEVRWGAPTGATVLNASIGQMFHQLSPAASLVNFSNSYPELIIRTTGNGTTTILCYFTCTYTVQPTIQFNIYAIKIA